MSNHIQTLPEVQEELETLRERLRELEEQEMQRISEEQERFDSLSVLDEYAKQLEESRYKLARLFRAGIEVQEAATVKAALDEIATSVRESGWGSVSVQLFENWEVIESAYAGCSQDEIDYLEGHRRPGPERARLFSHLLDAFKISRSYYVPGDRLKEVLSLDSVLPGSREVQPGDEWDPMDLAYVPMYGSDGSVIGTINCDDPVDGRRPTAETFLYLEMFADVAARKVETTQLIERQLKAEEELRRSEEKYRTLFGASNDGFFLMDNDIFRDCNAKACELWACDHKDIVGHSPVEFSPEFQPDGRLSTESALEYINAARTGSPQFFYWQHKRKDGVPLDCEVSLVGIRIEREDLIMVMVRNVTDRRRKEEEIAAWKHRYELISEAVGQVTFEWDIASGSVLWSGSLGSVLGYSVEEMNGGFEQAHAMIHPEDRDRSQSSIENALRTGNPYDSEYRVCRKDGSYVWVHGRGFVLTDASRKAVRMLGSIQDISQRKRVQEALRESEERYRRLIELSPDAIVVHKDGVIVYANPGAAKLLHAGSAENLMGRRALDFVHPECRDFVHNRIQGMVEQGDDAPLSEEKFVRIDGTTVDVEVTAVPFVQQGEQAVQVVIRDITQRKRAESIQAMLYNISEATSVSENLDELLETIRRELGRLVDTTNCYVALYNQQTDSYTFPYFVDEADLPPTGPEQLQNSLTDYVRRTGKPIFVDEETHERLASRGEARLRGTPSSLWLGVPLKTTHGTIGVVAIQSYHDPNLYTRADLDLVVHVSGHIAMAIERKRAEEKRRISEEKFRTLVEKMGDSVSITDLEERLIFANNAAGRFFGVPKDELIGKSLGEFLDTKQYEFIRTQTALRYDGISNQYEVTFRRPNGEERIGVVSATPQLDEHGRLQAVLAVTRDVTEERQSAAELLKLKHAAEASADVMFMTDKDGTFTYVNPAFSKLYGWTCDEVVGKLTPRILKSGTLDEVVYAEFWNKLLSRQTINGELQNRTRDGRVVDIEGSANPITDESGEIIGFLGLQRDASERKRAEAALRESQRALSTLMASLPGMAYRCKNDHDWTMEFASEGCRELTGYQADELVNSRTHTLSELIEPADRDYVWSTVQECLNLCQPFELEYRIMSASGDVRWVMEKGQGVYSESGELLAIEGFISDETERRRAEESLRLSERHFRSIIENISDVITILDEEGNILFVSPSCERWTGYRPEELAGNQVFRYLDPHEIDRASELLGQCVRNEGKVYTAVLKWRHKDGIFRVLDLIGKFTRDETGHGLLTINSRDITEHNKADERLEGLNQCLLSFGTDPGENINRLTALCGETLGATCALYSCLEGGNLCSIGQWQAPPDFKSVDNADGHICSDVIHGDEDELCVIHDLQNTQYRFTDPNVSKYDLQTYVGKAVKLGSRHVGSLCVVYQSAFSPSESDTQFIDIVAGAIGIEEARRRSEEALRSSEEKFRAFYEQSPVSYQSLDVNGNLLYVNETWLTTLGYTREEVIGHWFGEFIVPEQAELFRQRFPKFKEIGEVHGVDFKMKKKDGTIIDVTYEGRIARDEEGQFKQTHCIFARSSLEIPRRSR